MKNLQLNTNYKTEEMDIVDHCILKFKSEKGNTYGLDAETSTVIAFNDLLNEIIDLFPRTSESEIFNLLQKKYDPKDVKSCLSFVKRWFEKYGGIYVTQEYIDKNQYNMDNFNEITLRQFFDMGNAYQLILNVTEDCNLRCRYCYLSEQYDYTRCRTSKKMTYEIGKKAISCFLEKLDIVSDFNPNKRVIITFYGGEPLLEFGLIKKLIEYTKEHATIPVTFNMTTNGTIMTDEIIDYVVENNIYIAISFDGNQENHDRNRIFPDQQGTYEKIIKNINRFKEKYPLYRYITLISVFDINTDLIKNDRFFEEHDLPAVSFVNGVSHVNTKYYERFDGDDISRYQKQYQQLLRKYVNQKKTGGAISEYLRVLIEGQICSLILRKRPRDLKPPMLPFTGSCVPGMKISVRADGKYDMCERVNETMTIGDYRHDIDLHTIKDIIQKYNQQIAKNCFCCPAKNCCSLCFAQCMGDNDFAFPAPCSQIIWNMQVYFCLIYSILEENPTAFNDFEENYNIEWLFYN